MAIFKGRELLRNKSFADEGIENEGTIVLSGFYSGIKQISKKLKHFKRFADVRQGDSWYVGKDRWDAIIFKPSSDIKVYGIGLFESHPAAGEFSIGYRFYIEDED